MASSEENVSASEAKVASKFDVLREKLSFFIKSGWMLAASGMAGVFMYAVHLVLGNTEYMSKPDYGALTALILLVNMMVVPLAGIQLAFVHESVSTGTEEERGQLSGMVRGVVQWALGLSLIGAVVIFFKGKDIAALYNIPTVAALWVTLGLGLVAVLNAVTTGMLQGQMNFRWLGLAVMSNGLGRLIAVAVIVAVLGHAVAGAMIGVVIGMAATVSIGAWQTRHLWAHAASKVDWLAWFKRVIPLSVGFGAATVLLNIDMIIVQRFFPKEETGFYAAAGIIGRALVFLTAPLTQVLFPKIVQSAASSEKSNVLCQAIGATALLGGCAALACTLFPELPLKLMYSEEYLTIAPLVPVFAWCMLPLAMSNVLINNLMARKQFGAVFWLAAVAAAYWGTLYYVASAETRTFESVVKTLGAFGVLFLLVCIFFSTRRSASKQEG